MAEAANNGSAAGGAGEHTTEARRVRVPGAGSPPGMYGGLIGSGEVLDILEELREAYPDGRVHLSVLGTDGVNRAAQTYSVTSFDFDQVTRTYGEGEYRVRVQASGQPKPVKMFRFVAASAAPAAPAPAPTYLPPPQSPYPPPYYAPPPPPAPSGGLGGLDVGAMLMAQMQQQGQLVTMLLGKLIESQTKPQEPAKISELESMIKLADKLGRRTRDGYGEGDDLISSVVKGLVAGMGDKTGAQAQPQRPPGKVKPVKAHAGGAALPKVAPSVVPRPLPSTPETVAPDPAGQDGISPPSADAGPTQPAPPAPPVPAVPPGVQAFAAAIRSDPNARRFAKLLLVDEGDDVPALAAMGVALLDDATETEFVNAEPGGWAALMCVAFPQLEPRAQLMSEVEAEMRVQLADPGDEDEGDDQGDQGDDTDEDADGGEKDDDA